MNLPSIILSSILAFAPIKVLAQNPLNNIPVWARNRNNPTYIKIYEGSYTTYAVDRQYVLLNNGNYGITLYTMTGSVTPLFSRVYYEFNCQTSKYVFQGKITGTLIDGKVEQLDWIGPCSTEICQEFSRLDQNIKNGIKKYCPR